MELANRLANSKETLGVDYLLSYILTFTADVQAPMQVPSE